MEAADFEGVCWWCLGPEISKTQVRKQGPGADRHFGVGAPLMRRRGRYFSGTVIMLAAFGICTSFSGFGALIGSLVRDVQGVGFRGVVVFIEAKHVLS